MVKTLAPHAALQTFPRQAETLRRPDSRLDPVRIAAEAGAIAVHVAALLLLLAPLHPQLPPRVEETATTLVAPVRPRLVLPPPVPRIEPTPPRPVPVTTPAISPPKVELQPPVVEPEPGDTYVDPTQLADARPDARPSVTGPLAGAHLEYLQAPPPPYPAQALRHQLTGTVLLRVLVDVDGRPLEVEVERSSGQRLLDVAARRQVLAKWRFKPAMQDGRAVQALGLVPIEFTLDR